LFKQNSASLKIQFITRNIPTPNKSNNNVILKIALLLQRYNKVNVAFPKESVPFGFHFSSKYKYLYKLKDYTLSDVKISVFNYIRLPFKGIAFLFLGLFSAKKIAEAEMDVIHGHFIFPDGLIAKKLAKIKKTPFVVSVRQSDWFLLQKVSKQSHTYKTAKSCLEAADCIHVHNGYMASLLTAEFNVQSRVIPHGVDQSILDRSFEKITGQVVISSVAALITLKNIDWVIKSVLNYDGDKDILLKVIGDGEQMSTLVDLSSNSPRIRFFGQLSYEDVISHMESSHIFALPSCRETFGLVYLEAAATSNAIVAFNKYSINGVFEEGECLFSADFTSFQQLVHHLIDNPQLTASMGEKARKRAKELVWSKVINRYEEMYLQTALDYKEANQV
jgi:glycosyltransferase involved in cell wall biosynthesis